MKISERMPALRLPLGSRRDADEQERLLKLYWNRAELKKELASLDDQLHRLRDRLKQQEAATERAGEEREALETLLGNPELGFGALVHFQLRGVWRACHLQLQQFGADLRRQQEDVERKRQLVEFHQDRQLRARLAEERLAEAEASLRTEEETELALRVQLNALDGLWHYFRRRAAAEQFGAAEARAARARAYLEDMRQSKRTIEKEPWPELPGLPLEARRAINNAVIAYAQLLYARLAESGVAPKARIARRKTVQETLYGSRDECLAIMAEVVPALAAVRSSRDIANEIRTRTEALRSLVTYRSEEEAVPDPASLPSSFLGRSTPSREPNVLVDDYWDIYTVLMR
jgi:hypothetical protein